MMISDTAKETIDGWKAEGLAPTFEDLRQRNPEAKFVDIFRTKFAA